MTGKLGSRYVLDAVIGRGAFGTVWRGHGPDDEPLAFKVLHPAISGDPKVVERFVQERRILMSLDSPHLVRVRDMVVESDTIALVMDLVDGGDLRSHIRDHGPLDIGEASRIGAAVADGLQVIHEADVVHRDIKPENILMGDVDGVLEPRITDFGISRIATVDNTSTMLAGTPTYLAPELFEDELPTPAADLYALGIVMYEMVAGSPPFRTSSFASAMRAHLQDTPSRPEGVPDSLWGVVEKLLAKDPLDRPASASVVSAMLRGDEVDDGTVPSRPKAADATIVRAVSKPPRPDGPGPVGARPVPSADQTELRPRRVQAPPTAVAATPVPPPPMAGAAPPGVPGTPVGAVAWAPEPKPSDGKRVVLIAAAAAAVAVLLGLGFSAAAVAGVFGGDETSPVAQPKATAQPPAATTEAAPVVEETTKAPEPTPTPTPEPVAAPLLNRCWDGSQVERGTACSTAYDTEALFYAFRVDAGSCKTGTPKPWNVLSYDCKIHGENIHIAKYRSDTSKRDRLSEYGSCTDLGGGRKECAPAEATRHVLTYTDSDMLFYASVGVKQDYAALVKVRDGDQRGANEIRFGTPID